MNTPDKLAAPDGPEPMDLRLIGEILLSEGAIGEEDLNRALALQEQVGGLLGALLLRMGAVSEDVLVRALGTQLGMPVLLSGDLLADPARHFPVIEESGLPAEWWIEQDALPWREPDGALCCVAKNPIDPVLQETASGAFPGAEVRWSIARGQDIDRLVDWVRQQLAAGAFGDELVHLRELAEEAPVVEFVNGILAQAVGENASDIHIEPGERQMLVRFRLDGVLQDRATLPRQRFDAISSRIKLISGMDIAERRLPQDGRIGVRLSGQELDIRVSALPGMWGESMVLRLLPKERKAFRLDRLGMAGRNGAAFQSAIGEPHGIVLVTGPTGSGKSTTLYAALEAIHDGRTKIITVEDPVEYNIAGVTQIQTHSDIGFTFARALRAILRQDPDVIMIGEIRDLETAEIAIQASLTGHLVFSTLHTNDSLSAFTRLMDMGVEPFLVADSVRGVLAQRLVRRVCPHCARRAEPPAWAVREVQHLHRMLPDAAPAAPNWVEAVGCPACQNTGYKGRIGIYEYAPVTQQVRGAIMGREPMAPVRAQLSAEGYWDLRADGLVKACAGHTTVEEVLRTTGVVAE